MSRIESIKDSGTVLAAYTYLGASTVIRIDYQEPDVMLDLWGGTTGTFDGIDLFSRVIDQRWKYYGGSPTDVDRFQYGYDRSSNRQWRANIVGTAAVGNLDEYYTYDNLNRLTVMKRGTLTGTPPTGISGTPTIEQDWTLDPTGNWNNFLTKAAGTTTLDQDRASNSVNQITAITESTGPSWVDPAYDPAGNMTTMPQPLSPTSSYSALYDPWNRLVELKDGSDTVEKYYYDGANRRIQKDTYSSGTYDDTSHYYYNNAWQQLEERANNDTSVLATFVWGIRYIDELVCRDRLITTVIRHFACQDANFNVTSVVRSDSLIQGRYIYDPYGRSALLQGNWVSGGTIGLEFTYCGYTYDTGTGLYYVRNRLLEPSLGVWSRRDGADYEDGPHLYQYALGQPTNGTDPIGNSFLGGLPLSAFGINRLVTGKLIQVVSYIPYYDGANPLPDSFANFDEQKKAGLVNENGVGFSPGFHAAVGQLFMSGNRKPPSPLDVKGARRLWKSKDYRNWLLVDAGLYCCGNKPVWPVMFFNRNLIGYTPLGRPAATIKHDQGEGSSSYQYKISGKCVDFYVEAWFRIGWKGQAANKSFTGKGVPYAWSSIKYQLCCDGSGQATIEGSVVPSHAVYLNGIHEHTRDMVSDGTLSQLEGFISAGGDNGISVKAPGTSVHVMDNVVDKVFKL